MSCGHDSYTHATEDGGELIQKLEDGVETDGQTDSTDCSAFPANAIGNYESWSLGYIMSLLISK